MSATTSHIRSSIRREGHCRHVLTSRATFNRNRIRRWRVHFGLGEFFYRQNDLDSLLTTSSALRCDIPTTEQANMGETCRCTCVVVRHTILKLWLFRVFSRFLLCCCEALCPLPQTSEQCSLYATTLIELRLLVRSMMWESDGCAKRRKCHIEATNL